jgi:site-specific recombinase XerD
MCSIGCRYSDIPFFKVHHFSFEGSNSFFTWIQQKTDKRVSVPANDISNHIFTKYSAGKSLSQNLFPNLSNQKFNKGLKLLLKELNFNRIVTYPKKVGSKVVNDEDRFLWELISSHSGRRSFIKNMIDLGNMDYKTIMKLSGHKTMSEFEKYISVTKEDLKKGTRLYRMDTGDGKNQTEELIQLFEGLDDEKRKLAIQVLRSIQ